MLVKNDDLDFFDACLKSKFTSVQRFLDKNSKLTTKLDKNKQNALHYVVRGVSSSEQLIVLSYLIRKGVDVNQVDIDKNNILHIACLAKKPNPDLIQFIMAQYPCQISCVNKYGMNPFSFAVRYKKKASTKILIDCIEKEQIYTVISKQDTKRRSVLHLLSVDGKNETAAINIFCQLKKVIKNDWHEDLFCKGYHTESHAKIDPSACAISQGFYSLFNSFEEFFNPKDQRTCWAVLLENFHPYGADENVKPFLQKWANEQYQSEPYRQNTSLLLATDLLREVNDLNGADEVGLNDKYFKLGENTFSLADIVAKIKVNVGVGKRSIQFAAVGISIEGRCYVTWNHHTPCVFRLEDVLLGSEHFKKVKELKKYLKKNGFKMPYSEKNIHAETMISAIGAELKIETILTVSASGERKQNCLLCTNYLKNNGHYSFIKPHIGTFKNYILPDEKQKNDAVFFLQELEKKSGLKINEKVKYKGKSKSKSESGITSTVKILFTQSFSGYHIPKIDLKAEKIVREQQACDFMIKYYPNKLGPNKGTSYYSMAKRLSMPDSLNVSRYSSGKGNIATFPNLELKLCNDGRLRRSQAQGGRVSPIGQCSPRSKRLSEKVNTWLAGDETQNPSVSFTQDHILCTREKANNVGLEAVTQGVENVNLHKK